MMTAHGNGSGGSGSDPKKLIAFVGLCALAIGGFVLASVFPSASNQGYSPEQPIPFSHEKHSGMYKIPCMYCHNAAEKSFHATIPALNVCMNCHSVVKTESPFIQYIKKHSDANEPIEWVRIHELPDHVHFPHKRHIAAGVQCETCHGDVKTMARVYQSAPLTMGWCLECHRGQTTPKYLHQKYYPGETNLANKPIAPINCSACHY